MFPLPLQSSSRGVRLAWFAAVGFSLAIWMAPLIAVALTSLRSSDDLAIGNIWGWPNSLSPLDNYLAVITEPKAAQFLLNTILIAIPAVAGAVALSCMAGFALSRYPIRGAQFLLVMFVGGNLSPFQALMIPVRELALSLGIYDTKLALILFHASFQSGFGTLLMSSFMKQIPASLIEAARVDGASEFGIFFRIALPLMLPSIAATSVLVFTFVWNDFFWSLTLAQSDSVRPITAGLQALRGMWSMSWQLQCAGALLAAIPPVALFLLMQRYFVAGLSQGLR